MKRILKKFIKRFTSLSNERGNLLSTGIIVVAVLTFSITTITAMTATTAKQTTMQMEKASDEVVAKAMIDQSIAEFEDFLMNNGKSITLFESVKMTDITDTYGVDVADVTAGVLDLDAVPDGATWSNKAYKFSYTLDSGETLYKIGYVSTKGLLDANTTPYDYQVSSNGNIYLNGGLYDNSSIFGENVLISNQSVFERISDDDLRITSFADRYYPQFTVNNIESIIHYGDTYMYCEGNCYDISDDSIVIQTSPTYYSSVVEENGTVVDEISDAGSVNKQSTDDIFGDFNYRDWALDYIQNVAPSDDLPPLSGEITWNNKEQVIMDNAVAPSEVEIDYTDDRLYDNVSTWTEFVYKFLINIFIQIGWIDTDSMSDDFVEWLWGSYKHGLDWPDAPFVDVTGFQDVIEYDEDFIQFGGAAVSMVYNGTVGDDDPLVITGDISIPADESLVVIDDLVLDFESITTNDDDRNVYQDITGTIIVFGDLTLNGDHKNMDATFIVFGETFIDLDLQEKIVTQSGDGFAIVGQDNIYFNTLNRYKSSDDIAEINGFFYTEESIYIDAVNSKLNMNGSLFARAANASGGTDLDVTELVAVFNENTQTTEYVEQPVSGIIINSYEGYAKNTGVLVPGPDTDISHRFKIHELNPNDYNTIFANIPVFDAMLVADENGLTFLRGEFGKE